MSDRKFPWVLVLSGASLVLGVGLVAAYLWAMQSVVQAYYRAEYHAEALGPADVGQPPPAHRLADVPWLPETKAPAASAALRMLAAQQGRLEPRTTIDFLTGATWGATPLAGRTGFGPGQDPEPGAHRAAPQLGFTRRYLTTDDADAYLKALRTALARGRAVQVTVDRAALLDQSGLEVHRLVLVGYDAAGFEYYEPRCDDPKRCSPEPKPAGAAGLTVKPERLLHAEETLALALKYPWKYQLTVLEPAPAAPDLEGTLTRNARALLGRTGDGPTVGSVLVADTGRALERHGDGVVTPELLQALSLAAAVRADDADALLALFPGRPGTEAAAASLRTAAERYADTLKALKAKDVIPATRTLAAAAAADRAAGEALLQGQR